MKEKFQRFMQGRYGVYGPDDLNRFLMGASLVLLVLDWFVKGSLLAALALVLLVYGYYRMFSKDYSKRYAENVKFAGFKNKLCYHWDQQKQYHIYHCPSCKQKIRVPRGKGKIVVTCPKCKTEFQKKS